MELRACSALIAAHHGVELALSPCFVRQLYPRADALIADAGLSLGRCGRGRRRITGRRHFRRGNVLTGPWKLRWQRLRLDGHVDSLLHHATAQGIFCGHLMPGREINGMSVVAMPAAAWPSAPPPRADNQAEHRHQPTLAPASNQFVRPPDWPAGRPLALRADRRPWPRGGVAEAVGRHLLVWPSSCLGGSRCLAQSFQIFQLHGTILVRERQ